MTPLLEQIAETAASDLRKLIEEGADDITNAIHKAAEEAQLQESAPKFALGYKIAVDLDKSTFECALSWSFKQTLSVDHAIDDPTQEKLDFDDTKITIKTEGIEPVTVTHKQLKSAAKKLKNNE